MNNITALTDPLSGRGGNYSGISAYGGAQDYKSLSISGGATPPSLPGSITEPAVSPAGARNPPDLGGRFNLKDQEASV